MTPSSSEPLSRDELLARAGQAGIALPPDQRPGVLAGAQRLREAAVRLRNFLAEQAQ